MYLYKTQYVITGDIIDLPIPNFGIYDVVVGRDPAYKAIPQHDNFHWILATRNVADSLSTRALRIQVRSDGFLRFGAIGKNDLLVKLGENNARVLNPGATSPWYDPKDCYNLVVKIGGIYTFQAQSLGGGTATPFHIEQFIRHN